MITQYFISRIYYGWVIVAAVLVILTFATGLSFYNHAVILNALAKQSAFTVESASLAVSIFFLSGGFTGLWVAKLLDRFDPRVCISIGALLCGSALTLLAFVTSVWQLNCVYILFGMGFACSALIPATTLVTRWFYSKRAVALSIASTGLSLGGVLITPVSAALIGQLGLERAAPILGALYVFGVIPIALLLLRPSPESMGLSPLGLVPLEIIDPSANSQLSMAGNAVANANANYKVDGISFKEARRRRFFWCMSFAYVFLMLAQVGGIAHQYGLAREILSETQTALVVAILPIASIFGRLLGGWIIDKISIRGFAISMMVVQVASLSVLSFSSSVLSLCVGLALFGSSVGNLLMLQPLLIGEAFGVKEYARIFSVSNLMASWGTACGPWVLGIVYSATQNHYGWAYFLASMAGLVGMALFISGGSVKR